METRSLSAAALIEKDRALIWHPFTQMGMGRLPIPIAKGQGLYLYGTDGTRYSDAISSWWVNLHGHAHPYIVEKIKSQAEQLEHVIFADFTHAPAIALASRLLSILPGRMDKIFYSDNGSTAVETALKMALQYWHNQHSKTKRTQVICFRNAYHGDTFGAMSAAGKNTFNKPFWNHLFEVDSIDPPLQGHEERSLTQLQALLKKGDAACFIFEPRVMAAGGMIIYPQEGLNALIDCCKQQGVLTIADEVMTGFGRTDRLFACDSLHATPDLICLSKGITGGFLPLGATACTAPIYAAFLSSRLEKALLHGHSYAGNPLACSSALASLDLLLEESCAQRRAKIAACHREFCRKWASHPKLIRCESLGTLLALEYKTDQASYFTPLRDRLYNFFLEQGTLLRPLGNVLYLLPPYCIEAEELENIYQQIIQTLEGDL